MFFEGVMVVESLEILQFSLREDQLSKLDLNFNWSVLSPSYGISVLFFKVSYTASFIIFPGYHSQ